MDGPDSEWSNSLLLEMKKDFLTVRGGVGKVATARPKGFQKYSSLLTSRPLLESHLHQVALSTAGETKIDEKHDPISVRTVLQVSNSRPSRPPAAEGKALA
jgi:hypothetical protein